MAGWESKAEERIKAVFSQEIYSQAAANGYFSYSVNYEKISFFD